MGVWGRAPGGVQGQNPLLGVWERSRRHLCVKMCYIVTLLRMAAIFSLRSSVQYEMEEKAIWRQKSGGQATMLAH